MPLMRLDKLLSSQGVCSRGELRRFMKNGRVTVNGCAATAPDVKVDPATDAVEFDGRPVAYEEYVYYMMNKPAGVVSASRDPNQRTVLDLLPPALQRPGLFPAGRLDKDTEGFLLITDDGALAHELLSPKKHVEKRYLAVLDKPAAPEDAARLAAGLLLPDGLQCLPARLEQTPGGDATHVLVTLHEGKFHQVKRMFEACGKQVIYLKREAFGGLELDRLLQPGEARKLSAEEVHKLHSKP